MPFSQLQERALNTTLASVTEIACTADAQPLASLVQMPETVLARSNVVALHSARSYVGDRALGQALGRSREKPCRFFGGDVALTKAEFIALLDALQLRLVPSAEYDGTAGTSVDELKALVRLGAAILDAVDESPSVPAALVLPITQLARRSIDNMTATVLSESAT